QVVQDGLANKKKPPEPDANEPPGLGPEVKEEKGKQVSTPYSAPGSSPRPLFAVIPTFVIIGPIAVLAALFPAIFGGLALLMRRWLVLLTIASLNSTVFFLHAWFRGPLGDSWWGSQTALWSTMTIITLAGLVWSWRRNRLATLANPEVVPQPPQRSERILLGAVSITGLAIVLICLVRGTLLTPPWKELLVIWCVAWVGSLYTLYLGLRRMQPATGRRIPA